MPSVRSRLGRAAAGLLLLFAVAPMASTAHADTVAPPAPQADSFTSADAVRAMTWNICGEAGGVRGSDAFCPFRDQPKAKADAISSAVSARNLNAVLLQEVCYTGPHTDRTPTNPGKSIIDLLQDDLGSSWTFVSAEGMRPSASSSDNQPHSYCRDHLAGNTGITIGVKGTVNPADITSSLLPGVVGGKTEPVLCVRPSAWTTHVCTTHLSHDSSDDYNAQVTALKSTVSAFSPVVFGGDFNTQDQTLLSQLYGSYAECDQVAYYPGDQVNQPTQDSYSSPTRVTLSNGVVLNAAPGGTHTVTKIDYLFSSAGFSGCDVWQQLADHSDNYTYAGPPTGFSDHAPLIGAVRGKATLAWNLAESGGTTANDATGNGRAGTVPSGDSVTLGGGSAAFTGSGSIVSEKPPVESAKSLTVSAWAKLNPGAPSGAVASLDGDQTSGFGLWYNQGDNTWRFSMQQSDAGGWNADQAIAPTPPQSGVWTHLVGTFDAGSGTMSLYVNGSLAATHGHTGTWNAAGGFVVGRDKNNGNRDDFFQGSIADVEVFDYPFTAANAAALASAQSKAPTGLTTVPARTDTGTQCGSSGTYGTVQSDTPALTAVVSSADPLAAVRGDFSIWDNTDGTQPQPISMGGPGSASGFVTGSGTVQVTTPTLISGHKYGWRVQSEDAAGHASPSAVNCYFIAG